MELTFEWDRAARRLVQHPASPLASREENARYAQLLKDIQGDDPRAREVARYVMAELAYDQREYYAPVVRVPGGAAPIWMHNPSKDVYQEVREGLKMVSQLTMSPAALAKALADDQKVQRAAMFNEYVYRVAACEAHNEGCLRPLLMGLAVFGYMNPEGDAARIQILRTLVHRWYKVEKPARKPERRRAQAEQHTKRFDWLSGAWRHVWMHP